MNAPSLLASCEQALSTHLRRTWPESSVIPRLRAELRDGVDCSCDVCFLIADEQRVDLARVEREFLGFQIWPHHVRLENGFINFSFSGDIEFQSDGMSFPEAGISADLAQRVLVLPASSACCGLGFIRLGAGALAHALIARSLSQDLAIEFKLVGGETFIIRGAADAAAALRTLCALADHPLEKSAWNARLDAFARSRPSGKDAIWVYPAAMPSGSLTEYRSLTGDRLWLPVERNFLNGIERSERAFDQWSERELIDLIWLFAAFEPGLELDVEIARLREFANLRYFVTHSLRRVEQFMQRAVDGDAVLFSAGVDLAFLRECEIRIALLPLSLTRAALFGEVQRLSTHLRELLTRIGRLLNSRSERVESGTPIAQTRIMKIVSGARTLFLRIINILG